MTFVDFVTWVVVGLVTGSLATIAMKERGRGLVGDVTLGLGGSLIGRTLFRVLGGPPEAEWFVMAVVLLVGAAGVIAIQRTAWPGRI